MIRDAVFSLWGTQGKDLLSSIWFINSVNHILSLKVIFYLKNNDFTSLFVLSTSF